MDVPACRGAVGAYGAQDRPFLSVGCAGEGGSEGGKEAWLRAAVLAVSDRVCPGGCDRDGLLPGHGRSVDEQKQPRMGAI